MTGLTARPMQIRTNRPGVRMRPCVRAFDSINSEAQRQRSALNPPERFDQALCASFITITLCINADFFHLPVRIAWKYSA